MEEPKHSQTASFLEAATVKAAQIRLGGTAGLCMPSSHACPPIFSLGLDMTRQGVARSDIVEVIVIFLASSGESFMLDPLNRFGVTVLRLVLDGEGPEALRDEFETAKNGKPRRAGTDPRPQVFALSHDGKEERIEWADTLVSSCHDLIVRGDEGDGLIVRSTGSIRVVGQVGASSLEAGGYIDVEGCVFGKGTAVIRFGGDFSAAALERAKVFAGGDVRLGTAVDVVELSCAGDLVCEGGTSIIIGGTVKAGGSVRAGTIGGWLCSSTTVAAGDSSLADTPGSQPHRCPNGIVGITVPGTIHERVELSVGQTRMSVNQPLNGVKIREDGFLLRVEACDTL